MMLIAYFLTLFDDNANLFLDSSLYLYVTVTAENIGCCNLRPQNIGKMLQ